MLDDGNSSCARANVDPAEHLTMGWDGRNGDNSLEGAPNQKLWLPEGASLPFSCEADVVPVSVEAHPDAPTSGA